MENAESLGAVEREREREREHTFKQQKCATIAQHSDTHTISLTNEQTLVVFLCPKILNKTK